MCGLSSLESAAEWAEERRWVCLCVVRESQSDGRAAAVPLCRTMPVSVNLRESAPSTLCLHRTSGRVRRSVINVTSTWTRVKSARVVCFTAEVNNCMNN